jgi:hypothetical protein
MAILDPHKILKIYKFIQVCSFCEKLIWIPDILPKSRIGELRIKFEYGHQRNGLVEHRLVPQEIPLQTIHVQEFNS